MQDRRDVLKLAGAVGLGGMAAGAAAAPAVAADHPHPRGVTIATIVTAQGAGLGLRTPKGVLDVAALERDRKLGLPTTTDDLIHRRGNLNVLAALSLDGVAARYFIAEDKVRFGPCVTAPEKIICVGLNYRAHAAEGGAPPPKDPILFNKFNSSLNSHGGVIKVSAEPAKNFDYEAELVIVMGKTARGVSEADALSYAYGYCTGQDFTARELQMLTSQWMLGKAGDGWGPIGPWLVSADQVDPDKLDIKCLVNGEVRQSANTSDMIFNCRYLISFISKHMTLKPGDIIFTGTPEGVIMGKPKDKQVWLKAGDKLVTSIEKLGEQVVTLT